MKYIVNVKFEILANSRESAMDKVDAQLEDDGYIFEIKKCIKEKGE
jgi:hypothetical protein